MPLNKSLLLREAALDIKRASLPLWEAAKLGILILFRFAQRRPSNYPKLLRGALERLGVTYLKLGQYLAMRRDLLPGELCDELSHLYESASHLDFQQIKAVVEAELNGPLNQFFSAFEQKAVAAASVAQVHEARTLSNKRVAVKVQRPGIKGVFDADTRNLRRLAVVVDTLGISGTLSLKEVVEEFAKWTSREFDFLTEGRTADRLRHNATTHEIVPVVYWEFTTSKVLTMQFIDGMSLAQIISLVSQGREDLVLARLPSLNLEVTGHNMAHAALHQFFVCGFFHGDPHPGNVIILEDNSVAFVDFGIFGELTEYHQEVLAGYIESIGVGNIYQAFRFFSKLTTPTELTDLREFQKETMARIRHWYEASKRPAATFEDRHIGKYLGEILGEVRRQHLRMGVDTLLFWRAMSALDYSALSMSKHFDLLRELRIFFKHLRPRPVERLMNVLIDPRFQADVADLTPRIPGYLNDVMQNLIENEGANRPLVARESSEGYRSSVTATRCLVAALVGVSLTVAGLGSHFGPTLLVATLIMAAMLFSFSLVEAWHR